jgi:hypothetical protein
MRGPSGRTTNPLSVPGQTGRGTSRCDTHRGSSPAGGRPASPCRACPANSAEPGSRRQSALPTSCSTASIFDHARHGTAATRVSEQYCVHLRSCAARYSGHTRVRVAGATWSMPPSNRPPVDPAGRHVAPWHGATRWTGRPCHLCRGTAAMRGAVQPAGMCGVVLPLLRSCAARCRGPAVLRGAIHPAGTSGVQRPITAPHQTA